MFGTRLISPAGHITEENTENFASLPAKEQKALSWILGL